MAVKLDFTSVVGGGDFTPLSPGKYRATIFDIKAKQAGPQSNNPGSPYLEFTFQLPEEDNRRVWQNYSLLPNALWALKGFLIAVGYDAEKLTGSFELDEKELMGKECVVTLSITTWNGKEQNAIASVEPMTGEAAGAATAGKSAKKAKF